MYFFSHRYQGQDWHCMPAWIDDAFVNLVLPAYLRRVIGKQGTDWRWQTLKPTRSNRMMLSLLETKIWPNGRLPCLMFRESPQDETLCVIRSLMNGYF